MSEEAIFLNSGPLFSGERLEQMDSGDAWDQIEADSQDAYERIREIFEKHSTLLAGRPSLEETRFYMINPTLQALGFTPSVHEPVEVGDGHVMYVDYTLFDSASSFYDAEPNRGGIAFYRPALAVVKALPWGADLDTGVREHIVVEPEPVEIDESYGQPYEDEEPQEEAPVVDETPTIAPPAELDGLLRACGTDFGIITNGYQWRLYHRGTSERLDTFFQSDMIAALRSDYEEFKRFYLLCHKGAFLKGREGISFLDSMLQ